MALYLMHILFAHTEVAISVHCICTLTVYYLRAVTLVDTFERHIHISLQYRIFRLFVEKTSSVISRGFQLKHIPSGEVIRYPFSLCMSHVWQNVIIMILSVCLPSSLLPLLQSREVTHLQYIDWPDHGIPEDPQPFLSEHHHHLIYQLYLLILLHMPVCCILLLCI